MNFLLNSTASNSGPPPIFDELLERLRWEYGECDVGPGCQDWWCRLARDAEARILALELALDALEDEHD